MDEKKELRRPANLSELLDALKDGTVFIECSSGEEKDELVERLFMNGLKINSPTIDNWRRHTPDMDYPIVGRSAIGGGLSSYTASVKKSDPRTHIFMSYSDVLPLLASPLDFEMGEVSDADFEEAFSLLTGGDGNG